MNRYQSLDILRAFAVLMVIGHHTAFRFRPDPVDPFAAVFKDTGWIGVDIFFVISGYLITRILIEKPYGLRTFFRRRAYRILPIFFVAISVFIIAAHITNIDRELIGRIWSPALLLNGWTIPFFSYANVPYTITWSLSVEETAYVFLGLSSLAGPRGVRTMIFAMIAVAVVVRIAVVLFGLFDLTDLYFFVPARLDAIAIGGLVALGYFVPVAGFRWSKPAAILLVGFLIWLYQFQSIRDPIMPLFGYLLFSCAMAILICALTHGRVGKGRILAAPFGMISSYFVNFGQLSYFIYLFHIFVLEALLMLLPRIGVEQAGFWLAFCMTVAAVHILAAISWRYFEYPLIQRSRRDTTIRPDMVSH